MGDLGDSTMPLDPQTPTQACGRVIYVRVTEDSALRISQFGGGKRLLFYGFGLGGSKEVDCDGGGSEGLRKESCVAVGIDYSTSTCTDPCYPFFFRHSPS